MSSRVGKTALCPILLDSLWCGEAIPPKHRDDSLEAGRVLILEFARPSMICRYATSFSPMHHRCSAILGHNIINRVLQIGGMLLPQEKYMKLRRQISSLSTEAETFLTAQRQREATEILIFDIHNGNKAVNITEQTFSNLWPHG